MTLNKILLLILSLITLHTALTGQSDCGGHFVNIEGDIACQNDCDDPPPPQPGFDKSIPIPGPYFFVDPHCKTCSLCDPPEITDAEDLINIGSNLGSGYSFFNGSFNAGDVTTSIGEINSESVPNLNLNSDVINGLIKLVEDEIGLESIFACMNLDCSSDNWLNHLDSLNTINNDSVNIAINRLRQISIDSLIRAHLGISSPPILCYTFLPPPGKSGTSPETSETDLFSNDILGMEGPGSMTPGGKDFFNSNAVSTGVDKYNGLLQSSVNIYDFVNKDISIPITLNYQNSGIKPDSYAGETGQHWSLSTGASISRKVNGTPDDFFGTQTGVGMIPVNSFQPCLTFGGLGIAIGKAPSIIGWTAFRPNEVAIRIPIPIYLKIYLVITLDIKLGVITKPKEVNYEEKNAGYLYLKDQAKIQQLRNTPDSIDLEVFLGNTLLDSVLKYQILESSNSSRGLNDERFLHTELDMFVSLLEGIANIFRTQTIETQKIDTEPDEFYINVPGYSGKFMFTQDGDIYTYPHSDIIIDSKKVNGKLTEFIVHATDGLSYYFGDEAIDETRTASYVLPNVSSYQPADHFRDNKYFTRADLEESDYPLLTPAVCLPRYKDYKRTYENNHVLMDGITYISKWHLYKVESRVTRQEALLHYSRSGELTYYSGQNMSLQFPNFKVAPEHDTSYIFQSREVSPLRTAQPLTTFNSIYHDGFSTLDYIVSQTYINKSRLEFIEGSGLNEKLLLTYGRSNPEIYQDSLLSEISLIKNDSLFKSWNLKYKENGQCELQLPVITCEGTSVSTINVDVPGEWKYQFYDAKAKNLFRYFLGYISFSISVPGFNSGIPISFTLPFAPAYGINRSHIRELNERSSLLQLKSYHNKLDLEKETKILQSEYKWVFLESIEEVGYDDQPEMLAEFRYYENLCLLPKKLSFSKDKWGYFNGAQNNSPIPVIRYTDVYGQKVDQKTNSKAGMHIGIVNPGGSELGIQNDTAQLNMCRIGALESIKFKTGLEYKFEYELHDITGDPEHSKGAGLRVASMETDPGIGEKQKIFYQYSQPYQFSNPLYISQFSKNTTMFGNEQYVSVSTSPLNEMYMNKGHLVGYGEVTEIYEHNGRIVTRYTNPTDYPPQEFCSNILEAELSPYGVGGFEDEALCLLPFSPLYDIRDWRYGLEKYTAVISEGGKLISETENNYQAYQASYCRTDGEGGGVGTRPADTLSFVMKSGGNRDQDPEDVIWDGTPEICKTGILPYPVTGVRKDYFQINVPPALPGFQELRLVIQNLPYANNIVVQYIMAFIANRVADSQKRIKKIRVYGARSYSSEQFLMTSSESTQYFDDNSDLTSTTTRIYRAMMTTIHQGTFGVSHTQRPVYRRLFEELNQLPGIETSSKYYYTMDPNNTPELFRMHPLAGDKPLNVFKNLSYNIPLRTEEYYNGVLVGGSLSVYHYKVGSATAGNFNVQKRYRVQNQDFTISHFYDEWNTRGNPAKVWVPAAGNENLHGGIKKGRVDLEWSSTGDLLLSKTYPGDGTADLREAYTYNHFELLTMHEDVSGITSTYTYDGLGRLKQAVNQNALVTVHSRYEFNPTSRIDSTVFSSSDGAPAQTLTTNYNGLGAVLSVLRTGGGILEENTYDSMFRLKSKYAMGSGTTQHFYQESPVERLTQTLNSEGHLTQYRYIGGAQFTQFDGSASAVVITDPNGHEFTEVSDALSRKVGSVSAEGAVTKYYYDAAGRLSSIVNPVNQTFEYAYNKLDLLESKKVPGSGTHRYFYDVYRQPVLSFDANGNSFATEYDHFFRQKKSYWSKDPVNPNVDTSDILTNIGTLYTTMTLISENQYESGRNRVTAAEEKITGPDSTLLSKTTAFTYDNHGRISREVISYPDQISLENDYTYTGGSLVAGLTRKVNSNSFMFKNTYDPLLRLKEVEFKAPSSASVRLNTLTYDGEDRVVTNELRGGSHILQKVDYAYDGIGRLVAINSPFDLECELPDYYGEEICYLETNYQYRIYSIELLGGLPPIGSSCYRIDRIVVDGTEYTVSPEINLLAANLQELLQDFLDNNNIPGEVSVTRKTEQSSNPPSVSLITDYTIQITGSNIETLEFKSQLYPNQKGCHYVFSLYNCCPDNDDEEEEEDEEEDGENKDLFFEAITYNGLDISDINMINGCATGAVSNRYRYDADHRLVEVKNFMQFGEDIQENNYSSSYEYDLAGNLTRLNRRGWITTDTLDKKNYDDMDELVYNYNGGVLNRVTDTNNSVRGVKKGVHGISHDGNGNVLRFPGSSLVYNPVNLPKTITSDDGVDNIWYSFSGEKFKVESETDDDERTRYYIQGFELVSSGSSSSSSGQIHSYNFPDGRILLDGNAVDKIQFHIKDHLGNVMVVFEDGDNDGKIEIENDSLPGEIVERYMYYSFGMQWEGVWDFDSPSGDSINRMRYNGKEYLSGSHLYDYGARYYAPQIGRWGGVDPASELMPEWSTYNYGFNAPIRFIDPDGMAPEPPKVRIYTETVGFGHAFISVGSGTNTTVYTYGRYGELGKDKSVGRSTTPTGEGVLIRLQGQDALGYIQSQLNNNNAQVFEITDADGNEVTNFFNTQFESSSKTPKIGDYAGDDRARVVDKYSLSSNNCATKSCEGVAAGGSGYRAVNRTSDTSNPGMSRTSQIVSPAGLQQDLSSKSKGSNSNVKNVTNDVKKEYGN